MSDNVTRAPCTVPPLVGRTFEAWIDDHETPSWVRAAACSGIVESALRLAYEAGAAGNPVTASTGRHLRPETKEGE